jgi:virginiamycin B lyase
MQNRYRRLLLVMIVLLWAVGAVAERALAATFTEFPTPTANSAPTDITVGADDALWFTLFGVNQIGRITTAGVITTFQLSQGLGAIRIINGPDGVLWFTNPLVGRITTGGTITQFGILAADITVGPDGALWITEINPQTALADKVARMTAAGALTVEFHIPNRNSNLGAITTGPDGALWFNDSRTNQIGRITTD